MLQTIILTVVFPLFLAAAPPPIESILSLESPWSESDRAIVQNAYISDIEPLVERFTEMQRAMAELPELWEAREQIKNAVLRYLPRIESQADMSSRGLESDTFFLVAMGDLWRYKGAEFLPKAERYYQIAQDMIKRAVGDDLFAILSFPQGVRAMIGSWRIVSSQPSRAEEAQVSRDMSLALFESLGEDVDWPPAISAFIAELRSNRANSVWVTTTTPSPSSITTTALRGTTAMPDELAVLYKPTSWTESEQGFVQTAYIATIEPLVEKVAEMKRSVAKLSVFKQAQIELEDAVLRFMTYIENQRDTSPPDAFLLVAMGDMWRYRAASREDGTQCFNKAEQYYRSAIGLLEGTVGNDPVVMLFNPHGVRAMTGLWKTVTEQPLRAEEARAMTEAVLQLFESLGDIEWSPEINAFIADLKGQS